MDRLFIVGLLSFAFIISGAQSLQCYTCTGDTCRDKANLAQWATIRCPNTMFCLKYSINAQSPVQRNCGRSCTQLGFPSSAICEECNSDFCNSAHAIGLGVFLPVALLIGCLKAFFY